MSQPPTSTEIVQIIGQLEAGTISREAASQWSVDNPIDDDDQDPNRQEAMELLFLVDARHFADDGRPLEDDYLFGIDDLLAARNELQAQPDSLN